MSSNLQITQLVFNEESFFPQWHIVAFKEWQASLQVWTNLQEERAAVREQWIKNLTTAYIFVDLHRHQSWGGETDKRSSSPDTWPIFTAASHVTVLLREKAPFVSQSREGGRSLGWTVAQLDYSTRHQRKRERKKKGPDFPTLPGVLHTYSPPQHTNTGSSVVPLLRLWLSFPAT